MFDVINQNMQLDARTMLTCAGGLRSAVQALQKVVSADASAIDISEIERLGKKDLAVKIREGLQVTNKLLIEKLPYKGDRDVRKYAGSILRELKNKEKSAKKEKPAKPIPAGDVDSVNREETNPAENSLKIVIGLLNQINGLFQIQRFPKEAGELSKFMLDTGNSKSVIELKDLSLASLHAILGYQRGSKHNGNLRQALGPIIKEHPNSHVEELEVQPPTGEPLFTEIFPKG